jgi:undecaprenyl-diphosphatase
VLPFNFAQSYSFPSGHAAASFVAAYLLSKKDKKRAWVYYVVALLISFSRIYLGKHYPSDVLAGALIGTLIGWGIEIGMLKLYAKKK